MAIICSVCKRELGKAKSGCCEADIIKYEGEEIAGSYYRCSACGCICNVEDWLVEEGK